MYYPFSYPTRLVLLALVLAGLAGGFLCVLPSATLQYVGLFYGVIGAINVVLLSLVFAVRRMRLGAPRLQSVPVRRPATAVRTSSSQLG